MLSRVADQEDWRRKYHDSMKAVEEEGRRGRQQLDVLYRLIARLCVAAAGQSPRLDAELKRMRESVRSHAPLEQVEPLGKSLLAAIQELEVPAGDAPADIAAAQAEGGTQPAAQAFGHTHDCGDRPVHPLEPSTHAVLSLLLAELAREPQLADAAHAIEAELAGPMPDERKLHLIEKVAALVMQRISELEKSRRDLEQLLDQMLGQLDSFTRYISGQGSDEADRTEATTTLNLRITGEMQALGESVEGGHDLEQIRRQMRDRLNAIGQHLHMYRLREEERARQSRERSEIMRVRLDEMESEAKKLQARLSSEKRLSLLDPLTRIANRLAWDQRFAAECDRWRRFRTPTCVLAWDIDRFKAINDNYGHRAGDKVLAVVAESLARSIRGTDFVARYGGEEFVMLLPGTSIEDGQRLANRMREAIAQIGFHFRGQPVGVTVSCGITQMREGDDEADAFDRADKAMYQAKQGGRNRVVSV